MTVPPPSDAQQLAFLAKIQRMLEEGQFTATYKFALLVALTDIAVERGRDDGSSMRVSLTLLAEKFVASFWGHTRPYRGIGELAQNKGRNITILGQLRKIQADASTVAAARRHRDWPRLLARVARTIGEMPLVRLQTLRGNQKLIFLYNERIQGGAIELLPGVTFCLRQFAGFVRNLAQNGWIHEVRHIRQNAYLIDDGASLEDFLFGSDRVPLGHVRDVLQTLQRGKCFYCGETMNAVSHVDHFVPFALSPGNLAHNLVLAHAGCNGDKSDLLADLPHLEHWTKRNVRHGAEIGEAMAERGIVGDLESSLGIARWAYDRARSANALLWVRRNETRAFPQGVSLPI
jgi:5-methylcytosine-specific restriction endonuclease McrA